MVTTLFLHLWRLFFFTSGLKSGHVSFATLTDVPCKNINKYAVTKHSHLVVPYFILLSKILSVPGIYILHSYIDGRCTQQINFDQICDHYFPDMMNCGIVRVGAVIDCCYIILTYFCRSAAHLYWMNKNLGWLIPSV